MRLNRDELLQRLQTLEQDMPALMSKYLDADEFNAALGVRTDEVTDFVSAEDEAWAYGEIDRLLEQHGLWHPGQEDLPPDE